MNVIKNTLVVASSVLAATVWADAPQVSNVSSTQDSATRKVTVAYTVSAPAIVTLSVETNVADNVWAPIGDENLWYVSGDANKKVEAGDHTLTWLPHKAWPDHVITDSRIRIGVKAWALDCPPEIMAVDLKAANTVNYYSSAAALPGGVQDKRYKTDVLVLRHIPAANVTWTLGAPKGELGRSDNEVAHQVTLAADYWIGVYEVTQRQYEILTGTRQGYFSNPDYYATRPVDCVSYDGILKSNGFIGLLRTRSGITGFTLPTEAQWEFACRAGEGAALYNGQNLIESNPNYYVAPLARFDYNSGESNGKLAASDSGPERGSALVGSYEPNAWGLYDMLGNMFEWCLDWYQEDISNVDPATGPASGTQRVVRGGWHALGAWQCRCARRAAYAPSAAYGEHGFRVACPIVSE